MVQQVSKRPKLQCLKFLADYILSQQYFVTGAKHEQQAARCYESGQLTVTPSKPFSYNLHDVSCSSCPISYTGPLVKAPHAQK